LGEGEDDEFNLEAGEDGWLESLDVKCWDNNIRQCLVQSCPSKFFFNKAM
jgi:hypothetical protein